MRIIKLDESSKKNILNDLLKRSPNNYDNFADSVNAILANVKENGDKALFQYTKDFDKADINASNIKVTEEEIKEAYDRLENPELVQVIRKSLKNIKEYHEKQKQYSWFDSKPDGSILGQKVTPLSRVGVYVPAHTSSQVLGKSLSLAISITASGLSSAVFSLKQKDSLNTVS